jgi:arginase
VTVRVIGVPFNSSGHGEGVARAPAALRRAGLIARLGAADGGDVAFAPLRPERSGRSGLLAEDALVSMVAATADEVAAALSDGAFPLVVGGDCPVLLGALRAVRERAGAAGLVMVDGHEDAYPPHRSPTGEAADSELHLALGLPSDGLPAELEGALLEPRQVQLIGPRDAAALARDGVASLRGAVPLHSDVEVIARGPGVVAEQAARDVAETAGAWWLHVDLDVLATAELAAVDYRQPGGLTWEQLDAVLTGALTVPGCAGCSVAIYNPDLDGDGSQAARIVDHVAGVMR